MCCREAFHCQVHHTDPVRGAVYHREHSRPFATPKASDNRVQRASQNRFIKNYDFDYPHTHAHFTVTAVAGHLLEQDFDSATYGWNSCDPFALFDAPVLTRVKKENEGIMRNLKSEARGAQVLMIWTDCDREGEHIGSEIASVCRESRRAITVKRARFSAIIAQCVSFGCLWCY